MAVSRQRALKTPARREYVVRQSNCKRIKSDIWQLGPLVLSIANGEVLWLDILGIQMPTCTAILNEACLLRKPQHRCFASRIVWVLRKIKAERADWPIHIGRCERAENPDPLEQVTKPLEVPGYRCTEWVAAGLTIWLIPSQCCPRCGNRSHKIG